MKKSGKQLIVALGALALAFAASSTLASCGSNPSPSPSSESVDTATSESSQSSAVSSSESADTSSQADTASSSSSEPVVKYSITIASCEHGKVISDKKSCEKGGFVTLSISADLGYELESLLVNGVDKKGDVVAAKLTIVVEGDVNVAAAFKEMDPFSTTVSIVSTCKMAGMELTLKCDGQEDKKVTVGLDNSFKVNDVPYNSTYSVSGKVAGVMVNLGSFNVRSDKTTFNPSTVFNLSGEADFASSTFKYSYDGSLSTIDFTDVGNGIKDGDAYVATKVSISPDDMTKLRTTGEADFGIGMTVGGKTCWTDIWLKGADVTSGTGNFGEILAGGWSQGVFLDKAEDGTKSLNAYGNALQGGGFWLIAKYEASTGLLHSYIGTTLEDVKYLRDWGTASNDGGSYFEKDSKLTSFNVGKHSDWGNDVTLNVKFSNVRYGSTLAEALGIDGKVSLSSDSSYAHGKVDVSGKPYENVTLTFTPDEGYALTSVKVNGEVKEVKGNSLVLTNYSKQTVKVEAVFEETNLLSSVDVSIASGVSMDGVALTLKKGTDTKSATVSNGKFTLENVTIGDTYSVSAEVNGAMTSLGELTIKKDGNSFDPRSALGSGNGGTLNLKDSSYVYKYQKAAGHYDFALNEAKTGGAFLVTKISVPNSVITNGTEVLFGLSLTVGGKDCFTDFWLSGTSRGAILANNENKSVLLSGNALNDYGNALIGDGLYLAIQYDSASGRIKTYIGTSADSMAYFYDWTGANGWNLGTGLSVTGYSLGRHQTKSWGGEASFDVTYSKVGFGGTLREALGLSEAASDVAVSVPSNVSMNGLELTLKNGSTTKTATVANEQFTIKGASVAEIYSVSAKINGAMAYLGDIIVKGSNNSFDPSEKIGNGNGGTLNLSGSSYVYKHNGGQNSLGFSLSEAHTGDAYLVAKISISDDAWNYARGDASHESLFGLSLTVGGTECFTDIWLNPSAAAILANNCNQPNVFVKDGSATDYGTALKGTGLWLAVRYDSTNGKIETYIGTSAEKMTLLRNWTTTSGDEGWNISSGLSVTGYSLGHHRNWTKSGFTPFDVNYSNVGFGGTLAEALGTASTGQ